MATEEVSATPDASIEDVRVGQKMILYAILINIASLVARAVLGDIWLLLFGLVSAVLAVGGVLRLSTGLGYSTGVKILLIILVFVPLISLITLAIINGKATERLKAAGYRVGLMGARSRT